MSLPVFILICLRHDKKDEKMYTEYMFRGKDRIVEHGDFITDLYFQHGTDLSILKRYMKVLGVNYTIHETEKLINVHMEEAINCIKYREIMFTFLENIPPYIGRYFFVGHSNIYNEKFPYNDTLPLGESNNLKNFTVEQLSDSKEMKIPQHFENFFTGCPVGYKEDVNSMMVNILPKDIINYVLDDLISYKNIPNMYHYQHETILSTELDKSFIRKRKKLIAIIVFSEEMNDDSVVELNYHGIREKYTYELMNHIPNCHYKIDKKYGLISFGADIFQPPRDDRICYVSCTTMTEQYYSIENMDSAEFLFVYED